MIRVLTVDIALSAVERTLSGQARFEVRSAQYWDEAVTAVRDFQPAAIVVSLSAPGEGETEWIRKLSRLPGGAKVLVVTPPAEERRITLLLKAGAGGYLFADDIPHRLSTAVQDLVHGGAPMSPRAASIVLRRARRSSSQMAAVRVGRPAAEGLLSARQREVLALLARGHSYEDIALALDLSVNTVRTHLRAIYERLGASTKVEAVVFATELGLLPPILVT
ncbi:MAG TPA: response regulator transcription factor [Polyangiaceae bacterium]